MEEQQDKEKIIKSFQSILDSIDNKTRVPFGFFFIRINDGEDVNISAFTNLRENALSLLLEGHLREMKNPTRKIKKLNHD